MREERFGERWGRKEKKERRWEMEERVEKEDMRRRGETMCIKTKRGERMGCNERSEKMERQK